MAALTLFSLHAELFEYMCENTILEPRDFARLCCVSKYFRALLHKGYALSLYIHFFSQKSQESLETPALTVRELFQHLFALCPPPEKLLRPVLDLKMICANRGDFDETVFLLDFYDGPAIEGLTLEHVDCFNDENQEEIVMFWVLFLFKGRMYKMLNAFLKRILLRSYETDNYIAHRKVCFSAMIAVFTIGGRLAGQQMELILNTFFLTKWGDAEIHTVLATYYMRSFNETGLDFAKILSKPLRRLQPKYQAILFDSIEQFEDVRNIGFSFLQRVTTIDHGTACRLFTIADTLDQRNKQMYWCLAAKKVCQTNYFVSREMFFQLLRMLDVQDDDTDEYTLYNAVGVVRALITKQKYCYERCAIISEVIDSFVERFFMVLFVGISAYKHFFEGLMEYPATQTIITLSRQRLAQTFPNAVANVSYFNQMISKIN